MGSVGNGQLGRTFIGTGVTSSPTFAPIGTSSGLTANGVVVAQGLGAFVATNAGAMGYILTSNGPGSPPTFQAAAASGITTLTGDSGGAISPTAGNINVVGAGSTTVAGSGSTLTMQLTGLTNHALQVGAGTATLTQLGAGTTGQILQTNTTADPTWSTATYPSTAIGTGTLLRANGTNWLATTSTYPNTNAVNTLLYASSANVMSELATANNGVLITSATGVPSLLAAGTTGQVLTATTGSPASWAPPAASSISITGNSGGALVGAAFTFTGGTTGLTFSGSGSTETLTGTLILANGGTSASLVASNGGIFYSTAAAGAILAGTATANKVLMSGASTTPSWSTPTFPNASVTTRKIIVSDGTNWVASTETYAVPGSSGNVLTSDGTNWTSAAPPASGGLTWTVVTGTSQAGAVNNGYIANNAGLVTVTLPATSAVGDIVAVTGINNAVGWKVAQNAGNTIYFGSATTTPGTGGSLASVATRDVVYLLCVTANAHWNVIQSIGNITVV